VSVGAGVSRGVDADRLWNDLMALGTITEPDRPYTRRAFSPLYAEGRAWLTRLMHEARLETHIDAAGNLIGRRPGQRDGPAILVGSHSDSVPSGGRFDGMAGVLGGIEIARSLEERGVELIHPLEVIDFLAEEPNEFGLSCIGSRGIAGCLTAEHLALRNSKSETLAAELARVGGNPQALAAARRSDIKAAFELHIEQGPVLEAERIDIGLVSAIVGITRLEIEFEGTAGHAGTTPMQGRRDPLIAAAHMVGWVRESARRLAARGRGHFVATVGIIEVLPGGSNVIPRSARLVIDARSEDRRLMEEFRAAIDGESRSAAGAANVERKGLVLLSDNLPAACDPHLREVLRRSATMLELTSMTLASGAGHDMAFISQVAPAAMVFIPCKGGRSHTPEEWAGAEGGGRYACAPRGNCRARCGAAHGRCRCTGSPLVSHYRIVVTRRLPGTALGALWIALSTALSSGLCAAAGTSGAGAAGAGAADAASVEPIDPPPTLKDYEALARLPDWSGVWTPAVSDQVAQERSNPPPWKPAIALQIKKMYADEEAGHPFPVIDHCFPTGMPSWMLITHNAFEVLFTPGRVTLLGEGDGNRLRRIYTDGRPHPPDPDPSFHGHSIGHWEGDTLVIDTIAVLPQVYLAVNEAVGVPNDGDMHVVERLHLKGPNTLADELEISATRLLTKLWHTTRTYYRQRAQKYEIVEGVCQQGKFVEAKDANGNDIFVPITFHENVPVGRQSQ